MKISRRKFLRLFALSLVMIGGGSTLYMLGIEPFAVEVTQHRVPIKGLGPGLNGLRVVQISDLHMGLWISRQQLESVIALAQEQKPDLVLITGDCLSDEGDLNRALVDLRAALAPLTQSEGAAPVLAVMGNHDHLVDVQSLRSLFADLGIRELQNEVSKLERNGDWLYICGLDDYSTGYMRLSRVVRSLPTDAPAILMAHEPEGDLTARTEKFALQLSGHTHGGQVWVPWITQSVLEFTGEKYVAGMYRIGKMLLYTNRGIGMTHLPVRANCPPEISVFTLVMDEAE